MEVTTDRLGHHGDGIAAGPEGPVYAARCLPGERVAGELAGDRIVAPRVLEPSPDRVDPPCPHYAACGGCALLHASDAFVAGWKRDMVARALAAQGLDAPVRGIATSPARSRRRAALSGRRTRTGAVVGFHGRASDALTAVPGCLVLTPAIVAGLPLLEDITRLGGSRKGELTLTVTDTRAGLDISVTDGPPPSAALMEALPALATRGMARLTWSGEVLAQQAPPALAMGRARVVPPPGAFLQATAHGQAALVAAVRAAVGDARRIADLFAGCGTFALPLAQTAEILAVEGDGAMLAALEAGWRGAPGLRPVQVRTRDLFRTPLEGAELAGFDAVVIDPPRAGAAAQAAALAEAGPPRIASVSCNPATFARDAATLVTGGYRLDWTAVVDQFRWSAHVELAARFSRD
ncbi:class I SAM-dependent RNA methyltransferase [Meridianimarinicoccus sp. RP-17]